MDWTHVKGHWPAFIPRILTRWPDLDEDEVQATAGNRAAFVAYLSTVSGLDHEEADADVEDWLMGEEPADTVMDETRDNESILRSAADIPEGEDVYGDDKRFGDDNNPDPPVGRNS